MQLSQDIAWMGIKSYFGCFFANSVDEILKQLENFLSTKANILCEIKLIF